MSPVRQNLRARDEGASLVAVMVVLTFLVAGIGMYLNSMAGIRRIQEQRIMDDRALMAAEAGLANAISKLNGLGAPPSANETWTFNLSASAFSPFQTATVLVVPQTVNKEQRWTLASTTTYQSNDTRYRSFSRRVQATLTQQNFARYEYFVNNYGGVWSPGYVMFEGFGAVYLGPYHVNSGVAFWPNLWMLKETTTAAPSGVRYFGDFGSYLGGVYGNSAAHDYVNILNYFNSTYSKPPQFYGGLTTLSNPISIPSDLNTDTRATQLRNNAGLKLPAGYPDYDASKGPNFAIDLVSPSANSADSQVSVKQVLSVSNGVATYGPARTYNIDQINNSMIVYGNIKSLKGVLRGKLTVAAMKSTELSNAGNIDITGSVEYATRKANTSFKYTDAAGLYTADGSGINQSFVDTLMAQLDNVSDTLGLVAERDVTIKEKDLSGAAVAANVATPLYIDAVVMATGSSTGNSTDGSFSVENPLSRPKGTAYLLGGSIQNYGSSWALFDGNGQHTNGIYSTRLWDKRAYQPGGSPPYFPSTGNIQFLSQSWRSSYVSSAADNPWLPN